MTHQADPLRSRPLRADDFWRVRDLLVATVPLTPVGFNWDVRRLEGKLYYDARPGGDPDWHQGGQLWQTAPGRLCGLVLSGGPGWPHLLLHPDYRYLEEEMIAWAEANHSASAPAAEGRHIHFFVYEYDAHRQQLLRARGYERTASGGVTRHLRLGRGPLAAPRVPAGYTLRATRPQDGHEAEQIADLLNAAFERTIHNAAEYQNFTRQAPSYRPALDLVAVDAAGRIAAYVGIPYDEANRRASFEPMATAPAARRQGLARALMQLGLRRLRALGAETVIVETGDQAAANHLYDNIGFTERYQGYFWRRAGL